MFVGISKNWEGKGAILLNVGTAGKKILFSGKPMAYKILNTGCQPGYEIGPAGEASLISYCRESRNIFPGIRDIIYQNETF